MKIKVMFHCGNSPKMERVIELTIALAKKDVNLIKLYTHESFIWNTVGNDGLISFDNMVHELAKKPTVTELNIENALSHGNSAMCEGTLSFADGAFLYFCNVVKFVNTAKDALIKEAHTYFVDKI